MTTTLHRDATKAPALTPRGHALISERIAHIHDQRLPELRPLLTERERDERDVAEFERLLEEAIALEALLAETDVMTDDPAGFEGRVGIGMRVRITLADGSETWVRPVHPAEAFLDDERISITSPLATALLGARSSHVVWIDAPSGVWACTIVEIDPSIHG